MVSAGPHFVLLIPWSDLPNSVPSGFVFMPRQTTQLSVYWVGDTVDTAVTPLNTVLYLYLPRKLLNCSFDKVRSNVSDEETIYRASIFGEYWAGSDRMGHSSPGDHYWWPTFRDIAPYRRKKKRFCKQAELFKQEFFLRKRCPFRFVSWRYPACSFIWLGCKWRLH